jgi:hypothetical protein
MIRSNGHQVPRVRSMDTAPKLLRRMRRPKIISKKAKNKWFFEEPVIINPSFLVS